MAHVSRKLSNSFEGALAGGGDPATSPLYVFGPFLKLIVVAGVAQITFGASVWLAVLTIATVSAMYRLVMRWVTDGSGGSGLSEDEFGGWAVKVNASITFIEYTLTFLVSVAALVTFIADRFPLLNQSFLGFQYRTFVAIALSVLTGWLVNRGPKVAARTFGPATAGVLLLLWSMVFATIWKLGFHLPELRLAAFTPQYLNFTLGGYARILAVMTGIEVFANLVAAYEGTPEEKARKAFGSLLIIMGTTSVTMLIVGPAIFRLSDPTNEEVSVFTQTMDQLLPAPLPYLGTLVGIAVLLSASAASAQGIQNLALGLRDRHYIPDFLGQRNRFDVADKPVWVQVAIVSLCFLAFGTSEETYLAIYAAGVFILLSMTGWAAAKRLVRELRAQYSLAHLMTLIGTAIAAFLTSAATVIIFAERFFEGAWTYFLFIPLLYGVFTYFRRKLGAPSPVKERLGELEEAMLGGFGLGQAPTPATETVSVVTEQILLPPRPLPFRTTGGAWRQRRVTFRHVLVPLDGSAFAEQALPMAQLICRAYAVPLTLLAVLQPQRPWLAFPLTPASEKQREALRVERERYLRRVARELAAAGIQVDYVVREGGSVAEEINALARTLERLETSDAVTEGGLETRESLIVMSTHGRSGFPRWLIGSVASKVIQLVTYPVLLVRPTAEAREPSWQPQLRKLLVALDGSEFAERVLPFARALAMRFQSELLLLTVPEVPEAQMYGPMADAVQDIRLQAEEKIREYLESVAEGLREEGLHVRTLVTGSGPARTIVSVSEVEGVDLIMLATHGRGGLDRLFVGSVADRVVRHTRCPVFLLPIREQRIMEAARVPEIERPEPMREPDGVVPEKERHPESTDPSGE